MFKIYGYIEHKIIFCLFILLSLTACASSKRQNLNQNTTNDPTPITSEVSNQEGDIIIEVNNKSVTMLLPAKWSVGAGHYYEGSIVELIRPYDNGRLVIYAQDKDVESAKIERLELGNHFWDFKYDDDIKSFKTATLVADDLNLCFYNEIHYSAERMDDLYAMLASVRFE